MQIHYKRTNPDVDHLYQPQKILPILFFLFLQRGLKTEDTQLNSIFYSHLMKRTVGQKELGAF